MALFLFNGNVSVTPPIGMKTDIIGGVVTLKKHV